MNKKKIDLTTLAGLIIAFLGIGLGYYFEGGDFGALIAISPILIIFGGTIGVVATTMTTNQVKNLPGTLKNIFTENEYDFQGVINNFSEWTRISRREGIVALGEIAEKIEDPFIKRGMEYILEGNDYETVKNLLERELEAIEERHHQGAQPFEAGGGFAPTMGIIGTVLGLVVVLGNLANSDVGELGHGIAVAFLATLMGVGFSNLVLLPFGAKLKIKSAQEILYKTIVIEGILGILSGQNPKTLQRKMVAYLPESSKKEKSEE